MPGISMCARPKSAASITSCPMARSCLSVLTIPCTGPGICRSIKLSGVRSMNLLSSALPWEGLAAFPALLVFISVLLFSTATLAFYIKQTISFGRLRKVFERSPGVRGSIIAAFLGAATPFCTCTAIPLFLGMMEADIPLGPAVSFLLASPTINLGAIILLFVVFGWRIAVFYMCACLLAAVLVGWIIGRVPRGKALLDYLWFLEEEPAAGGNRLALRKAVVLGRQLTRKLLPWLALATLGGILIDTLVPTSTVASLSILSRGVAIPVVLTFMLAASGLS